MSDDIRPDLGSRLIYIERPDITLVHSSAGQKFYLGGLPETYDGLGVQVAISCINQVAKNNDLIEVLQIPFQDSMYPDDQPTLRQLRRWLNGMNTIIDGRDVLVHCYAGMNRSALMMTLYLLEYHSHDFKDRNEIVSKLRKARHPLLQNSFFERIIQDW